MEAEPDFLQLLVRLLKLAEENALLAALAGAFALLARAPRSLAQVRQPARRAAQRVAMLDAITTEPCDLDMHG